MSSSLCNNLYIQNNKYRINTLENQQQIDARLANLALCLKHAEKLRFQTDYARSKLKENLAVSFEQLKVSLNHLESKTMEKLDKNLLQNHLEIPVRDLETDIHQIIRKLKSLSMLNDSEKLIILKKIDSSFDQIKQKLDCIEKFKKYELDNLLNSSNKADLDVLLRNQFYRIEKSLLKENINLNTLVMLDNASGFVQEPEYKKWLLNFTSDHQWESNHSSDHECEIDLNTNNKRRDSFEFVDMNDELESIGVLTDFDDGNYKNWLINETKNSINTQKNDEVISIFKDISSKPMEYWLLKTSK